MLAEWKDERYYQATVVGVASRNVDVEFADGSVMTVHRENVVKCGLIFVGCTVLAKSAQCDWYAPAVIQAYYVDGETQQNGYMLLFSGQTSNTRYYSAVYR